MQRDPSAAWRRPLSAGLAVLVLAACQPAVPTVTRTASPAPLPAGRDAVVERVVDGDTIVVDDGERVRLTGIDTPETEAAPDGAECYGDEASERLTALLGPGTAVRLVRDVRAEDRFGRTLAYVYRRADGRFVNETMVAEGFAEPVRIEPDVRHADAFARLADEAALDGRGLWGACR